MFIYDYLFSFHLSQRSHFTFLSHPHSALLFYYDLKYRYWASNLYHWNAMNCLLAPFFIYIYVSSSYFSAGIVHRFETFQYHFISSGRAHSHFCCHRGGKSQTLKIDDSKSFSPLNLDRAKMPHISSHLIVYQLTERPPNSKAFVMSSHCKFVKKKWGKIVFLRHFSLFVF